MLTSHPLPTPHRALSAPFNRETAASHSPGNRFPSGDSDAARSAYRAKKAEWAKLPLRQDFADAVFMREHIKASGLRAPLTTEPATASRLRSLLARAGVRAPEIFDSVGKDLQGFLSANPVLPLWAALALVLESTGRFSAAPYLQ